MKVDNSQHSKLKTTTTYLKNRPCKTRYRSLLTPQTAYEQKEGSLK